MSRRTKQVEELLRERAAEFFNRESDRSSLITVTDVTISKDLARATIFVTVFPEEEESKALEFARRGTHGLYNYLKERVSLKRIPHLTFELDLGEKNRQRIEELSQNT